MDNKTFGIGVLSLTGLILFIANLMPLPQPARAAEAIKDRDYQLVTAKVSGVGDALYVCDSRTGMVAVFVWDNAARAPQLRDVQPMSMAFGK